MGNMAGGMEDVGWGMWDLGCSMREMELEDMGLGMQNEGGGI